MRKGLLLSGLLFLCACGGAGSGVDSKGFYSLSVSVSNPIINSPASAGSLGDVSLPEDTISGSITLTYDSTQSKPLRGIIKGAYVCIGSNCLPVGLSGLLVPGSPMPFSISTSAYKYLPPWVVLNPYEDEVLRERVITDSLSLGVLTNNTTDNYTNRPKSLSLTPPVVKSSLLMSSSSGVFKMRFVYSGYNSARGEIRAYLPKGITASNSIVPNSFRIDIGAKACVDDGSGNIVDEGGGSDCSGTINYTTGLVKVSIAGVSTPTDALVSYKVQGIEQCFDDGNGGLTGDCEGSINYSTGQVSYKFNYEFESIPQTINVSYQSYTGSTDGLHYYYTLPPDQVDSTSPFIKVRYGDNIEVYAGTTLLCSTSVSQSCRINRDGTRVSVEFSSPRSEPLTIKYTERAVYDFNPSVDARAYQHLWEGKASATVSGKIRINVKLEDGSSLTADAPLTFYVYPR